MTQKEAAVYAKGLLDQARAEGRRLKMKTIAKELFKLGYCSKMTNKQVHQSTVSAMILKLERNGYGKPTQKQLSIPQKATNDTASRNKKVVDTILDLLAMIE